MQLINFILTLSFAVIFTIYDDWFIWNEPITSFAGCEIKPNNLKAANEFCINRCADDFYQTPRSNCKDSTCEKHEHKGIVNLRVCVPLQEALGLGYSAGITEAGSNTCGLVFTLEDYKMT